jgi:hypothetical protein
MLRELELPTFLGSSLPVKVDEHVPDPWLSCCMADHSG